MSFLHYYIKLTYDKFVVFFWMKYFLKFLYLNF